ncbi:MAG: FAD-dependent oxidoreductase [Clostridia bacterium]|nr:FAD-dependent oxidoreductase [Clostridia bacterium]
MAQEIAPVMGEPWVYEPQYFEDFRKMAVFEPQPSFWRYGKHTIALGERVTEVETDGGKIVAVVTTDVETGKKKRYKATLFSDCSGDGTLARLAGAETMYGRESRAEYGETLAPERAEKLVMGHSVRWCSEDVGKETEFPELDWNMPFTDENCLDVFCGDWEQETGFRRDMVVDIEYIRDYGLRAIYANWSFQKNAFKDREKYKNYRLKWVSPLGGKRESYRVKGDLVLTQQDIEEHKFYEDQTACITWSIDMHFPETDNEKEFGEAFRSFAYHRGIVSAYPVPYRCLYSKDISNLFLGGRIVSCSHVAFSAVRVMRTLGMLGEVVGLAAGLCKRFSCAPRDIYTAYLADLKAAMQKGVDVPAAFEGAPADDESYHFKDLGWVWIHNGKIPTEKKALEKIARNVQKLGLSHKYGLPKPIENTEEKPE